MVKIYYKDVPSEKERRRFARYLAEDEELILATGVGKTYIRSVFIVGLVWPGAIFFIVPIVLAYIIHLNLGWGLLGGLALAAIVSFMKTLITYHANRYLLTTRRVIIKKGLFAVVVTAALFDKVTHIEVIQSFFDKILMHHGTIIVNTAGMNKGEITLKFVEHPIEFKNILERLINRERELYGGHGATVTLEGEVVDE